MTKSNMAEQLKCNCYKIFKIFHNESVSILQYSGILATKRQEKSFNENVLIRK